MPESTPTIPPPYPYYDDSNYLDKSLASRSRQNILNIMKLESELEQQTNHTLNYSFHDNHVTDENLTETNVNNHNNSLSRSTTTSGSNSNNNFSSSNGNNNQSGTYFQSNTLRSNSSSRYRATHNLAQFNTDDSHITSTVSRNWEYVNVSLTRVPGYGFGIAVSGGCDNPHFANGDPAIAISDVLKGGPAQGKLQINDRIISANGISLDNVDYSTAVQILRDSGPSVNLRVKRRINPQTYKVQVPVNTKRLKKLNFDSLGFTVSVTLQIKTVDSASLGLREGDIIDKIQGLRVNELFNEKVVVKELKRVIEESSSSSGNGSSNSTNLNLTVKRSGSNRGQQQQQQQQIQQQLNQQQQQLHHEQLNGFGASTTLSTGNLYVQPPTRNNNNNKSFDNTNSTPLPPPPPPPRPPLPLEFDGGPPSSSAPHRTINFIKQNQLGIRLSGGNKTGIIVSAVQKNSQAELQGLTQHDKIIRVNEHDFIGNPPTREQAIEILSSIPNDTLVNLTVEKMGPVVQQQLSDNQDEFYVRTRFGNDDFKVNELLLVTDTLVNGLVGHWEAYRVDSNGNKLPHEKMIIPNVKTGRDMLKKSWKRTTSFRNREYEELLHCSVASDPYDFVDRKIMEPCHRPVVIYSPINSTVIECLTMLKHASRVFKVVKGSDQIDFVDGRIRVVQDLVSVKFVQEMYDKRVYPIVVFANFASKDALKEACKEPGKYAKAKKLFTVLGKVSSKLGSYVDYRFEARDAQGIAAFVYQTLIERGGGALAFVPTSQRGSGSGQQQSTPSRSGSQQPTTPVHRPQQSHSRHKSSDSLSHHHNHQQQQQPPSSSRTPTAPSPASVSSLKFPNFNIPPPCSVIDTTQLESKHMSSEYEKRVTLHRSHTSVGHDINRGQQQQRDQQQQVLASGSSSSSTQQHHHHQQNPLLQQNTFAHSPVFERRENNSSSNNMEQSRRATSNPPPMSRNKERLLIQQQLPLQPVNPPAIDRTKKPSSSHGHYGSPSSSPTKQPPPATTPKPVPPPKPKLPKYDILPHHHLHGTSKHFRPQSNSEEGGGGGSDDTGQTYLNIPMNSKVAMQQQQQQQAPPPPPPQMGGSGSAFVPTSITSGYFDWRGGRLVQKQCMPNQIPIEVFIPERAIPIGESVNVWFQIIDYNVREDGGTPHQKMLSPLVKFGPENYRFQIPVEIRIPQYSASSSSSSSTTPSGSSGLNGNMSESSSSSNMLAKVLMNNQSDYWTKIDIQNGNFNEFQNDVKVVSLTVQQF